MKPSSASTPLWQRLHSAQVGIVAGAVLMLAAIWLTAYHTLRYEYRAEATLAFSTGERTAQKLAARTAEVFDRVDQSVLLVKFLKEHAETAGSLEALRSGGVLPLDVACAVFVADARGFVTDSTSELIALNVADEDGFKLLRGRLAEQIHIGPAAPDALADGWVIPVSRRLEHPDGGFGGIVTANVEPAALAVPYGRSEAEGTAIGVIGQDGVFRSRLLDGKVSFGDKVDIASLQARIAGSRDTLQPVRSRIDGIDRFMTLVQVERYPLLAVVATDAHGALAGYRRTRDRVLAWAGLLTLLVSGAVLVLRSHAGTLDRSRRRTQRAEAAFRAALEGSLDAVSILQAVRDDEGRVTDMLITDCNARAAGLIGRTREELLGQALCALTPSVRVLGFLEQFDRAIRSGRARNAEIMGTEPSIAGRWLHHQVVPLDDGIALITRDVTDRKSTEAALTQMARLDSLTQLANRSHFEDCLAQAHARSLASGKTLALVYIDLDGFKQINDGHGHAAGDRVLVEVAARLRAAVRASDTVGRLGGDEFTVIAESAGTPETVREMCERLLATLSQPHRVGGQPVSATPSIGVAILGPAETPDSLLRRADAAMYRAKLSGKARYAVQYPPRPAEVPVLADVL